MLRDFVLFLPKNRHKLKWINFPKREIKISTFMLIEFHLLSFIRQYTLIFLVLTANLHVIEMLWDKKTESCISGR